jgi:hypothetical protein
MLDISVEAVGVGAASLQKLRLHPHDAASCDLGSTTISMVIIKKKTTIRTSFCSAYIKLVSKLK